MLYGMDASPTSVVSSIFSLKFAALSFFFARYFSFFLPLSFPLILPFGSSLSSLSSKVTNDIQEFFKIARAQMVCFWMLTFTCTFKVQHSKKIKASVMSTFIEKNNTKF